MSELSDLDFWPAVTRGALPVMTVRGFYLPAFLAPWHRASVCDCRITTASPVAQLTSPLLLFRFVRFQGKGLYYILCFWRWTLVFFTSGLGFLPLPSFSASSPGSSASWAGIHDGFHARAMPSDEPVEWARRLTNDGIYCLACSANTQYLGLNRTSSTR